MLYARVGDLERASAMYREAATLAPRKLSYRWLLGDVYHSMGMESRAEHLYAEAAEIDDYEADFVRRARGYMTGSAW